MSVHRYVTIKIHPEDLKVLTLEASFLYKFTYGAFLYSLHFFSD